MDGSVKLEISWAEEEGGEPSLDQKSAGVKPGYYQIMVNGTPFDDLEPMPEDATPPFAIKRRNVKTYTSGKVL